jgi:hypothetical protein
MSGTKRVDRRTTREAKRAQFNEKEASGASPLILIGGLVVVLALIGGALFTLTRPSPTSAQPGAQPLSAEFSSFPTGGQNVQVLAATHGHDPFPLIVAVDGAVRLPLATFDDYRAHYYTYMHEGRPIEFFVLKSKDGVVRAAFNACDVCYLSKRGYTQDGDYVVCNNCGQRFPADEINDVHGGCNPSPLGRVVEGDTLVILVADIVKGQGYF